MYRVTVIMPVYNNEGTLNKAIDSILNQTVYDLELILINDGSTDTSAQICDEYAKKEPLLIEVIHQERKGFGLARNKGLLKATGTYIYFADATDTFERNMLKDNIQIANEKEADLVVFGFTEKNKESRLRDQIHLPSVPFLSSRAVFRDHYRNFHLFFPYQLRNKIYRRAYLNQQRLRFHKIKIKEEAFFNLSVYKELNRVAFNRISYCNTYGQPSQKSSYKINLELAKYFESVLQHWGHEETFRDLIVKEYYQAVYSELLNISAKEKSVKINEKEEIMNQILKDEKIKLYLKDLNISNEKNPYMRALLSSLQNGNGKSAVQLVTLQSGTEKTTSKVTKILRKIFRR